MNSVGSTASALRYAVIAAAVSPVSRSAEAYASMKIGLSGSRASACRAEATESAARPARSRASARLLSAAPVSIASPPGVNWFTAPDRLIASS